MQGHSFTPYDARPARENLNCTTTYRATRNVFSVNEFGITVVLHCVHSTSTSMDEWGASRFHLFYVDFISFQSSKFSFQF